MMNISHWNKLPTDVKNHNLLNKMLCSLNFCSAFKLILTIVEAPGHPAPRDAVKKRATKNCCDLP